MGLLAITTLTACDKSPVAWEESTRLLTSDQVLNAADGISRENDVVQIDATTLPSAACEHSVRLQHMGSTVDAVYWSPRPDSTSRLEFARSRDNGKHWDLHSVIDSTDIGHTGCRQSTPSIAVDTAMHYVHVSYAMQAKEGPGVFFAHSMDDGGLFHAPVPIVYGERLGRSAVAAAGDRVVVAFEDPNGSRQRIGLALSRTMGHIFEDRITDVSGTEGSATDPMVTLGRGKLRVTWRERTPGQPTPVVRVRTGTLP